MMLVLLLVVVVCFVLFSLVCVYFFIFIVSFYFYVIVIVIVIVIIVMVSVSWCLNVVEVRDWCGFDFDIVNVCLWLVFWWWLMDVDGVIFGLVWGGSVVWLFWLVCDDDLDKIYGGIYYICC